MVRILFAVTVSLGAISATAAPSGLGGLRSKPTKCDYEGVLKPTGDGRWQVFCHASAGPVVEDPSHASTLCVGERVRDTKGRNLWVCI